VRAHGIYVNPPSLYSSKMNTNTSNVSITYTEDNYPYLAKLIMWYNEKFKCIGCGNSFRRGDTFGQFGCRFHTKGLIPLRRYDPIKYKDIAFSETVWECCGGSRTDIACTTCDHRKEPDFKRQIEEIPLYFIQHKHVKAPRYKDSKEVPVYKSNLKNKDVRQVTDLDLFATKFFVKRWDGPV
jgi:hypothetical protein